ncbi:MAG: cytochrome b/b6 domain-containing protein [Betaproteobacteria bacterium]|nr:cytochrome b/b6 domain-containing protein [Betaproteobacteria bacterium]
MSPICYERQKVYDGMLRLIHAWNALAVTSLILTGAVSELFEHGASEKALWQIHILFGYGLLVGLAARIAWGLVGPAHARFSDMWHPSAWWSALRTLKLKTAARFGHHPLASAAYLAVYGMLLTMAVTGLGLAAIEHNTGPLVTLLGDSVWLKEIFKGPHEVIYSLLIGFVVIHIAALIWHETVEKTPLAQSMVSGFQYRIAQGESDEQNDNK